VALRMPRISANSRDARAVTAALDARGGR